MTSYYLKLTILDSHNVTVTDSQGDYVPSQIDQFWEKSKIIGTQFTLHFMANVPGFGMSTYFVKHNTTGAYQARKSSVEEYTSQGKQNASANPGWNTVQKPFDPSHPITVENSQYPTSKNALLQYLLLQVTIEFNSLARGSSKP